MKKILAFAGSNHSKSINHQLLEFTASLFDDVQVELLDLRNWEVPMYSIDTDPDETPEIITSLIDKIKDSEGFIIACPEHNGGTPAFFKNIIDWLSRRAKKVFEDKPAFLLSTSPGAGGGANNLRYLIGSLPYQGAEVAANFSLPFFPNNFMEGKVVGDQLGLLTESLNEFRKALKV